VPGQVGAQASSLVDLLEEDHPDLELDADALYRLTLWLDLNSNFFGVYHDLERQAAGETVLPLIQ